MFLFYLFYYYFFFMNVVNFVFFREHAKAKRCLKNLIDSDCNFPAQGKQLLELAYGDYNPFCANNRDPGATGNDQCDGVQDISKYLSAAAGIKSGVLKTLMLAFLLLLFFFKV